MHELLLNVWPLKRLSSHIPNTITLLNLLSGAAALVLASRGYLALASGFIGMAAVFDFFDGLAARLLKVHSFIGEQLDSLADLVSFGLAPSFLLFQHLEQLHAAAGNLTALDKMPAIQLGGMALAFLPVVFAALRLARFNIDARQKEAFIGVPAPAIALLFAAAIMLYHRDAEVQQMQLLSRPWIWQASAVAGSLLMVLPLHMFSLKFRDLGWPNNQIRYVFVGFSLILLVLLHAIALPLIIIWYILLSVVYHIFEPKFSRL